MFKLRIWFYFFSFFFLYSPSSIASEFISFDNGKVSLGDKKSITLKMFEKAYHIECLDKAACNAVLVMAKGTSKDPIGSVFFKDERVEQVKRFWHGKFQGKDLNLFVATFYSMIQKLKAEGLQNDTIVVKDQESEGAYIKTIELKIQNKMILIHHATNKANMKSNVTLDEWLGGN